MANLRELVTVLRYELREGELKKYVDGYRRAEKAVQEVGKEINKAAAAVATKLNGSLRDTVRTTGQADRGAQQLTRTMGRLVRETREFAAGLRDGARRGYGDVIRQMDRVEARQRRLRRTGAGGVGEGMGFLSGAIQGVIATVSGRALMEMSDEWSGLQARIGLQTSDVAARNRSREFLFRTAQRTGQGVSPLADTFVAMARGRQALGLSNDQTLQLSSVVSKLMTIGGGSAASQEAALTQFGQAMNTGVLRGEELNSILEQAPRLAQGIAEALGVSVGQLRTLGQEGKITSKAIADGLLKQTQKVDDEFARLPMTFSRSWTMVRNQIVRRIGELNDQYNLAERFNRIATIAIQNMDKIGAALGAIAGSYAAVKVFSVLSTVLGTMSRTGRVAILFFDRIARGKWAQGFAKLGPLGLNFLRILRGIGLAISGIGAVGLGVFAAIAAIIAVAALAIYKYWEPIKAWFTGLFQGIWDAAKPALGEIRNALGELRPAWDEVSSAIGRAWDWLAQLVAPVHMTSEELRGAAEAGRKFGIVLGFVIGNSLRGFAALIRAVAWVIDKLGTVNRMIARVPITGTWARALIMATNGPSPMNVSPAQIQSSGRSPVNQSVTNTYTGNVNVTAPSSNPAAVGAAAQRGTRQAFSGITPYQLPTPVEAF